MHDRLIATLRALSVAGEIGTAWQVCVVHHGEVVVDAGGGTDGIDRAVDGRHKFAMYCAAKTLMVLVCMRLVEAGELSLDDQLQWLLPVDDLDPSLRSVTVDDLLRHRSGIVRPGYIEATVLPSEERLTPALRTPRLSLRPSESIYTEAAAWLVLGECVRAVTGLDPTSAVEHLVLAPFGLSSHFDLAGDGSGDRRINVSVRDGRVRPLLLELGAQLSYTTNPGYGGFATAAGLALTADLISAALDQRSDIVVCSPDVAHRFLAHPHPTYDRAFRRTVEFVAGFQSGLADQRYGVDPMSRPIGQNGLTGMTAVVADPDRGSTIVVRCNGFVDADRAIDEIRPRIWQEASAAFG